MKKLLVLTMLLLFAFTISFAQSTESTFKKNEISLAPYAANFTYYNTNIEDGWNRSFPEHSLLRTNYRRYLNENTALRFGGEVDYSSFFGIGLNIRVGFEKYLPISSKFKLYGGAQASFGVGGLSSDDFSSFGVGADLIGGVRYNINDKWSISSEVIAPLRYGSSSSNDINSFLTGVIWQPVKLNFSF